jgi:hypothetical protein
MIKTTKSYEKRQLKYDVKLRKAINGPKYYVCLLPRERECGENLNLDWRVGEGFWGNSENKTETDLLSIQLSI